MTDQAQLTRHRITSAALTLVARRGLSRLSMTDIGAQAKVSRGTLYRYFTSRQEVLTAVERGIEEDLRQAVEQAVRAEPALDQRVEVVVQALSAHLSADPRLGALAAEQPALVLGYLDRRMAALQGLLLPQLSPALQSTSLVQAGTLTSAEVVDVLLRLLLSHHLVPGSDRAAGTQLAAALVLLAPATAVSQLRRAG